MGCWKRGAASVAWPRRSTAPRLRANPGLLGQARVSDRYATELAGPVQAETGAPASRSSDSSASAAGTRRWAPATSM
jgi:hypothetical protein